MRRLPLCIIAILSCLLFVVPAYSTPVSVGDIVQVTSWNPTNGGGELTYYNYSALTSFTTFCIEKGVYTYPNSKYQIADISDSVITGGSGLNVLNPETKWLFYAWAVGALAEYSKAFEVDLQLAIWFFQGQIGESDLSDKALYFVNLALKDTSDGSLLPVFAANPILLGSPDTEGQSFLVVQTPEPLTLILLGAGLLGLAGLRRKE